MATRAKLGVGARVRVGRGATPTWTTIREPRDIETPDRQRADVDVSHHDIDDLTEVNIPGLFAAVDWPLEHTYDEGSAEDLLFLDLVGTDENVLLEIQPADSTVVRTWLTYVKGYKVTLPVKAEMRATATFRVMGEVTT